MKNRFKFSVQTPVAMVIAVVSGVAILATYLGFGAGYRTLILDWVMIMAAAALLVGVLNLASVHTKKVVQGKALLYSGALVAALIFGFAITYFDPEMLPAEWLLSYMIIPIESALMGIMAITLTYAAIRLVSQRPNVYSVIFLLTVVFTLAAGTAIGLDFPFIQSTVKPFITHVLASAGARGILIGVALGTITTGLRILMGIDRPYGG